MAKTPHWKRPLKASWPTAKTDGFISRCESIGFFTPTDTIAPPPSQEYSVTDTFSETQASVLIGTAEKMIVLWERLTPEKQATLLKRFGTKENALAALIATQLVAPL